MSQNTENKILTGVIWKQLLIFFFPILIGTFFQQLYNTVDAVIVGRFVGKEALSSVGGSAGQIINLVVGFFTGLTAGGTVLISQYYGAGQRERLEEALHTAYAFSIVGGILFGIAGVAATPSVLRMMNTPEELMAQSTMYMQVYFGGLVFVFLYNMGASILRAMGDSRRPLYFLMVCSVVNIILDIVFVVVANLGVLGVAVATLITQAVSAVLVTYTLMYRTEGMTLRLKEIRLNMPVLKNILRIGLPTGIQSSMYSLSNMIIQSALNLLGVDTMAAWTAYGKIDCLFWMINSSFGIAVTTFVGQNFGAAKYDRVKKGTRVSLAMAVGTAVCMSTLLMLTGRYLFMIFTDDATVMDIGLRMMHNIAPTFVLFVFIEIFSGSLRAQGHTLITTLVTLIGICLFRVIWVTFIVPGGTMEQVVACYPISWFVCAVVISIYYRYKQKRILQRYQ